MLCILMLALTLIAAAPQALTVVDETGKPIAGASIVSVPGDRIRVSAPGYETRIVIVSPDVHTIVLQRALPVIASVRVATGSPQTLPSLPVAPPPAVCNWDTIKPSDDSHRPPAVTAKHSRMMYRSMR